MEGQNCSRLVRDNCCVNAERITGNKFDYEDAYGQDLDMLPYKRCK
jgi:hypothetical protein